MFQSLHVKCCCCCFCGSLCRLDNALQEFMKDFADRMKEIKHALSDEGQPAADQQQQQQQGAEAAAGSAAAAGLSLAEKEALCDELMDIVESVDCARGGLSEGGRGGTLADRKGSKGSK